MKEDANGSGCAVESEALRCTDTWWLQRRVSRLVGNSRFGKAVVGYYYCCCRITMQSWDEGEKALLVEAVEAGSSLVPPPNVLCHHRNIHTKPSKAMKVFKK